MKLGDKIFLISFLTITLYALVGLTILILPIVWADQEIPLRVKLMFTMILGGVDSVTISIYIKLFITMFKK